MLPKSSPAKPNYETILAGTGIVTLLLVIVVGSVATGAAWIGSIIIGYALTVGFIFPLRGFLRDIATFIYHSYMHVIHKNSVSSTPLVSDNNILHVSSVGTTGTKSRLIHIHYPNGLLSDGVAGFRTPSATDGRSSVCEIDIPNATLRITPVGRYSTGKREGTNKDDNPNEMIIIPLTHYFVKHITAVRIGIPLVVFLCLPITICVTGIHYGLVNLMAAEPRSSLGEIGEYTLEAIMLGLPLAWTTWLIAPLSSIASISSSAHSTVSSSSTVLPYVLHRARNILGFIILYDFPVFLVTNFKRGSSWGSLGSWVIIGIYSVIYFILCMAAVLRIRTRTAFALVRRPAPSDSATSVGSLKSTAIAVKAIAEGAMDNHVLPPDTHIFFAGSENERNSWVTTLADHSVRGVKGVSLNYLKHIVNFLKQKALDDPYFREKYDGSMNKSSTGSVAYGWINPTTKTSEKSWYNNFLSSPSAQKEDPTIKLSRNSDPSSQPDAGPATTFVSHAWSESFPELVKTLQAHEKSIQIRDSSFRPLSFSFDANFRTGEGRLSEPPLLEERPSFYWLDIIFKNQHEAVPNASDAEIEAFREDERRKYDEKVQLYSAKTEQEFRWNIGGPGCTYMIADGLSYGNPPKALGRVWCLYEVLATIQTGARLSLIQQLQKGVKFQAMNILIDTVKAQAFKKHDEKRIKDTVRREVDGGFVTVNGLVHDAVLAAQVLFLREQYAQQQREVTTNTIMYFASLGAAVFAVIMTISAMGSYALGEPEAYVSFPMAVILAFTSYSVGQPARNARATLTRSMTEINQALNTVEHSFGNPNTLPPQVTNPGPTASPLLVYPRNILPQQQQQQKQQQPYGNSTYTSNPPQTSSPLPSHSNAVFFDPYYNTRNPASNILYPQTIAPLTSYGPGIYYGQNNIYPQPTTLSYHYPNTTSPQQSPGPYPPPSNNQHCGGGNGWGGITNTYRSPPPGYALAYVPINGSLPSGTNLHRSTGPTL